MSEYRELDRLAGRQHGLIALRQCERLDLSRRQIQWFIRTGAMIRVRPGVYRWCGAVPSWEMMAMASVLAAGEGAALSHRSAGRLWGLLAAEPGPLEITCARWLRLAGVTAHQHRLVAKETTRRDGIPVTTPARTLLDLAESCATSELGRLIDDALRRDLTTLGTLETLLRNHEGRGRRRRSPMRDALRDRGAGYDPCANDWEQQMQTLYDRMGLPAGVRQFPVRTRRRRYVIDRALPELKIGIEFQGRAYHGTRSGFDYDSRRRNDLTQAGWLMLDFTTNTAEEEIKCTVQAAVGQRTSGLLLPA